MDCSNFFVVSQKGTWFQPSWLQIFLFLHKIFEGLSGTEITAVPSTKVLLYFEYLHDVSQFLCQGHLETCQKVNNDYFVKIALHIWFNVQLSTIVYWIFRFETGVHSQHSFQGTSRRSEQLSSCHNFSLGSLPFPTYALISLMRSLSNLRLPNLTNMTSHTVVTHLGN